MVAINDPQGVRHRAGVIRHDECIARIGIDLPGLKVDGSTNSQKVRGKENVACGIPIIVHSI